MRIVVLDDYQYIFENVAAYSRLSGHQVIVFHDTEKDVARLAQRLGDAEVVVLTQQRSEIRWNLIKSLPNLRLIAQTGTHSDHIDIDACNERGILITTKEAGPSHSTAELTWALIMASRRHLPQEVQLLKEGGWQSRSIGTELRGQTLGIYALGKIGGWVAQYGAAFGMRVMCLGRDATRKKAQEQGYVVAKSRDEFFESTDVVSLHMPLIPQTRGIVSAADLARMKTSALIVNTSRSRLIEDGALRAALENGRPGYAALDVHDEEPITCGSDAYLRMPNVLCTPHLGYAVRNRFETYYANVVDSILAFAEGNPVNVLNMEAAAR